jgi:MFS transporter, DHA1 family, tetracycline resistance protein
VTTPLSSVGSGRRAALAFIFITILIDVLAFGVIIPVLPHLVEDFVGGDKSAAAYWVGFFSVSFAIVQFFSSPIQGALSDRFGRRPVILLSCLGLGIDFIFMALAPSLAWLFVGRIISAITSASFSTANAYIADITTPENRAKSYGMIGAAFGLGFVLGPLIGGVLGDIDQRLPFWCSAGLALLNFAYGLFVLPESLPKERRSATFDWAHAKPLGGVNLLRNYPQIWGLVAVIFLANFAHYVYPSTFVLFADVRFGWQEKQAGYVLALVGVLSVTVNAVLVGKLVKAMGERRALLFGLSCGVIGFVIYGFADRGWIFLLGLPISALWAIATHARPYPRRDEQFDFLGRHRGPRVVRGFVRLFHRPKRTAAFAGYRLPDRIGIAGGRRLRRMAVCATGIDDRRRRGSVLTSARAVRYQPA